MRVCLGGTFDPFHRGHAALLDEAAALATELFVGVTSGALSHRPDRDIAPIDARIARVEAHLADFGGQLTVRELTDASGPAASGDYDAIVVSPETQPGADRINEARAAAGLPLLKIVIVHHVLAQDLLPISATRIAAGDIDADGKRVTHVRVAVGSANPVKVAAVEEELVHILRCPVEVRGIDVDSGVPEQPKDGETLRGAQARARAARDAWPACDYAVGIEAGIQQDPAETAHYDCQACVVVDREGLETDGWGPAFQYPRWVTDRALDGEMISDILGPIADDPRIGGTTGAIGYLTDGRMDRTALTRAAVLMAFVPRIRRHLYA